MSCSRIVAANHELRTTSFRSSATIATQGRRLDPSFPHLCTMHLPRPLLQLQQTIEEEDDSTLIRYLIVEDKPNYELLDDDNEDMDTMMAAMDHESSFHRSIHKRRPL
ncbi:unnamed protein product [Urochloa humidicola]